MNQGPSILPDFALKLKSAARILLGGPTARFRGSFATYAEAIGAVRDDALAGYDHDEITDVSYEQMSQLMLWDYPVLFWLDRLVPQSTSLLDAGGHMGTKFRAFRRYLPLPDGFNWAVYDLPAMVRAGRARAAREGLVGISFHDCLEASPPSDLLVASGLLQYLDIPFTDFMRRLPRLPRHLLLNKVATRDDPSVVTLEQFPNAEVPYQVRNRVEFVASIAELGYEVKDEWVIPSLTHAHPAFGVSTSRGFYARLGA